MLTTPQIHRRVKTFSILRLLLGQLLFLLVNPFEFLDRFYLPIGQNASELSVLRVLPGDHLLHVLVLLIELVLVLFFHQFEALTAIFFCHEALSERVFEVDLLFVVVFFFTLQNLFPPLNFPLFAIFRLF